MKSFMVKARDDELKHFANIVYLVSSFGDSFDNLIEGDTPLKKKPAKKKSLREVLFEGEYMSLELLHRSQSIQTGFNGTLEDYFGGGIKVENGYVTLLNLSGRKFEYFPSALYRLERLEDLDISSNKLKFFPEDICRMSNLRYLDCSNNDINKLDNSFLGISSLQEVHFSGNPLDKNSLSILKDLEDKNKVRVHY